MSTNIKLKRSSVPGKIPLTTDVELGELAINTYDGKLYMKKNDGTESIVDVTAGGAVFTLDSVTDAGNTTTNDITVGGLTANNVTISDSIIHSGDTNTKIRFPAADTVTVETDGAERLRVTSTGNVGIGTTSPTQPLDVNGNIAITGNARRITGDFSDLAFADRVAFQTNTVNGNTSIPVLPNGSGTVSNHLYSNNSDPTNSSTFIVGVRNNGTEAGLNSNIQGTGTYLPMTFRTGNGERMRIDTSGNVGIGTSLPSEKLDVSGGAKITSNLVLGTSADWTFTGSWRGIKVSDRHALQATTSASSIALSSNAAIGASGWEYTVSEAAGNYTQAAGIHIFNRAPAGTDGDAVTFEESMRITATGNVGIGTTNPATLLDVNGDVTITDKIIHSGDTNTAIRFPAADTVTVETNGSERMRIDSAGRLGLGVSNPATRIQVAAQSSSTGVSIAATEVDYLSGFRSSQLVYNPVDMTGTTFGVSNSNLGVLSFLNTTNALIGTNGNTPLIFATLSTERMRITSTGDVGIGAGVPNGRFHISGSGNQSVRLTTTGGGIPFIAFETVGLGSQSIAGNVGSVQNITFSVNSAERFRIDSAGNVGIGTTAPATALDVNGDVTITDKIIHSGDTNTAIRFPANDTVTVETSGSERMRITSTGNVGIGTTTPGSKLDVVAGSSGATGIGGLNTLTVQNSGDAGIAILTANSSFGSLSFGDPENGAIGRIRYQHSVDAMLFNTAGSERMRITSTGNVGIGTNTPATLLDVNGDVTITDKIIHSGDTNTAIRFPADDTFAVETDGAERMRVTSTGNVGIGISSPTTNLHIRNSAGSGKTFQFNAGLVVENSGTSNAFYAVQVSTGAANDAFSITNAGNVGIGTTNPATLLDVNGDVTITDKIIHSGDTNTAIRFPAADTVTVETNGSERMRIDSAGNVGIGTSSPATFLHLQKNSFLGIRLDRTGAAPSICDISNEGSLLVLSGNASGVAIFTGATPTEKMRVDTTGNVGIGTAAPATKLDVNGEVTAVDFNTTSDINVKENISKIDDALNKVQQLNGVTFNFIDDDTKIRHAGVIAQDVEKVLPEAVKELDGGIKHVAYGNLIGLLIEAIKEQQKQIDELKSLLNK